MKYTVKASANDTTLNIVSGEPIVTVDTPVLNKPPVVAIDVPATIVLPDTLTLKATATDLDGSIVSYLWSKTSGPAATITSPDKALTTVSAIASGTYVFSLKVTDDKGAVTTTNATVIVKPAIVIQPPSAIKYLQLPKGEVKTYNGLSDIVIDMKSFDNRNAGLQGGNILWFNGCNNIKIINCTFGNSAGVSIYFYNCNGAIVESCLAYYSKGFVNASRSQNIYVKNLQMVNGYGSGAPYEGKDGNLYKLIECKGPGFGVENCRVHNFTGESNPEDIVSLYASEGTQASPVKIIKNIFVGGGPSTSGGGIVAGDGPPNDRGGWVDILDNVLLNPGSYGAAAAGGHDIRLEGNKIWSDRFAWSNNPLFIYQQGTTACSRMTVRNNYGSWTDKNGGKNNGWNDGACSNVVFEYLKPISWLEMKIAAPDHLINFLTPAELLQVRAAK